MFWLFNNYEKISFTQIFPYFEKIVDTDSKNSVYDFSITTKSPNTKEIIPIDCIYTVYIKDNYIQYQNESIKITWLYENEFITETDEENTIGVPYIKWKYTLVNNHKMPNIINYDFYYEKVQLKIYKFSENNLYVEEQINDNFKKYILKK